MEILTKYKLVVSQPTTPYPVELNKKEIYLEDQIKRLKEAK
jgi:hypothetical protein